MNSIVPSQAVEYSNQRILTTEQIAKAYGADTKVVLRNFQRNKDRYTEGKHYFLLEGEKLKTFMSIPQNEESLDLSSRQIDVKIKSPNLYLWTEKGAWLLAKSLQTDKAWEACEMLVDEYYSNKQLIATMKEDYLQLQTECTSYKEECRIARAVTFEAVKIPSMHGVDQCLFDEFERLVMRGHKLCWNLSQATTNSAILKILEEILPLLKRLEILGKQLQEQNMDVIDQFTKQDEVLFYLQTPTIKLLK